MRISNQEIHEYTDLRNGFYSNSLFSGTSGLVKSPHIINMSKRKVCACDKQHGGAPVGKRLCASSWVDVAKGLKEDLGGGSEGLSADQLSVHRLCVFLPTERSELSPFSAITH